MKEIISRDALLIVDVQNDFMTGGSLAVPDAEEILPPINDCIAVFSAAGRPVFASRDYHPADHSSFKKEGGIWPPHCVAGTWGAEFHKNLKLPDNVQIISKATSKERDAYSAMDNTELGDALKQLQADRIFICGLATDYCVLASVRDLIGAGFHVVVLTDGIRAVNVQPDDGAKALDELTTLGAELITWQKSS